MGQGGRWSLSAWGTHSVGSVHPSCQPRQLPASPKRAYQLSAVPTSHEIGLRGTSSGHHGDGTGDEARRSLVRTLPLVPGSHAPGAG